jgi:NADH:ubiquinone oxidoreductase subunit K
MLMLFCLNQIILFYYLLLSSILFIIGVLGIFIIRKNIIIILMSIELILLSVDFNFIIFSIFLDDIYGQLCALIILTIAASESAIGLAILIIYYRLRGIISVDYISIIKG